MKRCSKSVLVKIAILAALIVSPGFVEAQNSSLAEYYISPTGNDSNNGTSAKTPFKTIQRGLDVAKPGTILTLAKGAYDETLTTKINGTEAAPIVVRGADVAKDVKNRYQTILYGTGRVVNVNHSFYRFEGFAIDGQKALAGKILPADANQATAFKDANRSLVKDGRLIYVGSRDDARDLMGIKITNMYLRGAGGECVRLRNGAHRNEISNSVIEYCGMFGKKNGDAFRYHNGEGVYIGTSPKSTAQPMHKNDVSSYNVVADNIIHTFGSECFNVKENAHHNSFVRNECRYNLEPLESSGSNIELRGDHNLIEGNLVSDSAGWNLKLKSDDRRYDRGGNTIRNNTFKNARGASIQNESSGVEFCGNTTGDRLKGTTLAEATKQCSGANKVSAR